MATRKKAKSKPKKKKTKSRPVTKRKKTKVKKKATARRVKTKTKPKAKPKPKVASRPAPAPVAVASEAPPGMERIGVVTHFYNHLSVAILKLESGVLRVGDTIHIKGHTSDFTQLVDSMEVDHVHVNEARPGQSFGLRVKDHAREHDVVYKAKA